MRIHEIVMLMLILGAIAGCETISRANEMIKVHEESIEDFPRQLLHQAVVFDDGVAVATKERVIIQEYGKERLVIDTARPQVGEIAGGIYISSDDGLLIYRSDTGDVETIFMGERAWPLMSAGGEFIGIRRLIRDRQEISLHLLKPDGSVGDSMMTYSRHATIPIRYLDPPGTVLVDFRRSPGPRPYDLLNLLYSDGKIINLLEKYPFASSSTVSSGGRIFIITAESDEFMAKRRELIVLDGEGNLIWDMIFGNNSDIRDVAPITVEAADGREYAILTCVEQGQGNVLILDHNGKTLHRFEGAVFSSPILKSGDGNIIVVYRSGVTELSGVTMYDGKILWTEPYLGRRENVIRRGVVSGGSPERPVFAMLMEMTDETSEEEYSIIVIRDMKNGYILFEGIYEGFRWDLQVSRSGVISMISNEGRWIRFIIDTN